MQCQLFFYTSCVINCYFNSCTSWSEVWNFIVNYNLLVSTCYYNFNLDISNITSYVGYIEPFDETSLPQNVGAIH